MHKDGCAGVLAVLMVLLLLAIGCNGKETGEVTEGGPGNGGHPYNRCLWWSVSPESDTGLVHQAWMDKIVEKVKEGPV